MGARRASFLIVFLLLPGQAWAHRHKKELVLGFSAVKGSTLAGGELSGVKVFPRPGRTIYSAVFVDVGANWGLHDEAERKRAAFLIGGRIVTSLGEKKRVQPFIHGTLGFVWTKDSAPNLHDWASGPGFGGGVDVCLKGDDGAYARIQADKVWLPWSDSLSHDYVRYSAALVIR
ncbi:MAG TPA: hypothetical protein VMV21_06460, partial [Vicinamibacteria bacterium]|nr:hypothetical protein [Vicinamibacteria bacterium]